jgi:1-acyl-sn-glycerol-3-phosphate acyltransferase
MQIVGQAMPDGLLMLIQDAGFRVRPDPLGSKTLAERRFRIPDSHASCIFCILYLLHPVSSTSCIPVKHGAEFTPCPTELCIPVKHGAEFTPCPTELCIPHPASCILHLLHPRRIGAEFTPMLFRSSASSASYIFRILQSSMRYQKHNFWTDRPEYRWIQRATAFLFDLFGDLESHGTEHIPRKGGILLLSNHVSFLDPAIIATVATREVHFMARDNIFIPGLRRFLRRFNVFPVRRGAADRAALQHAVGLLENGEVVLIFPEGTRSFDGNLGQARHGASFIAYAADVPTIPVFLKGPERMMPRHSKFIHPAKLSATFGPPIDFTDIRNISNKREMYRRTGEQIMRSIADLQDASRYP